MSPAETHDEIPPLDPAVLEEITALSDDLDPILTRRPRAGEQHLAPLAERRLALLAHHLGRRPDPQIEPLHCVGDSNTMFFAGAERLRFIRYRRCGLLRPRWINRGLDLLPVFRTFHVGASTAWKAVEFGASTLTREKIEALLRKDLDPPARILLSFGEIDCRIHMARAALKGRPIDELVGQTADKFIALPLQLKERGFRPVVWAPPAVIPKDEKLSSPTFPFVGPFELRRDITLAYNEQLKERCRSLGIPCVCLTGRYFPAMERTPRDYFHDGVHLSQRLMPLALRELARADVPPIPEPG